jgi:two-component system, OmpR family, sensor kinase
VPIRWRLTLYIALAIGAILLILGFVLFFLLRDALLSSVENTTRQRAENAASSIREGESLDDDDIEELTLDGVFVIVRDETGGVLTETVDLPKGGGDPVSRRALETGEPASGTVQFSGEEPTYVYAVPVNPEDGRARVVEAGKSYEAAQEGIEALVAILAVGIGAAFVLSMGGAYLLARAALRPVETVTSTARSMGEEDLSKRLPVANPKDEIGRLATTINGLLARLEAAFTRREEALSRQRRFAADASHELRTPLTSISGHARMLDEWALEKDRETARRSVRAIRREAGRMRDLVESLLTLTRGDEGPPLDVGRHDLGEIAKEAVETARNNADGRLSVEFVPPDQGIMATFDRGRILQVASILLDNAVKYTPEGGTVTVGVRGRGDRVELEVSDNGVGIREDDLPLVFERFHRTDAARAEDGAGLGLSIARQIAETHGGTIEATSKVGAGSVFVLVLPLRKPSALPTDDT